VYLVAIAVANNAHIRFTYWAEPKISFGWTMTIIAGGIVFLSLIVFGVFAFYIDLTLKESLAPTVKEVKKIFTDAIEKVEPGTLKPDPTITKESND
jgi:hypothetical protein